MSEPHRRRRRRATAPQGEPARQAKPERRAEPDRRTEPERQAKPARRGKPDRQVSRGASERGMRDLAGSGASQVGISAALRARAVNRPSEDELAVAEREVEIVRRNWQPSAD